MTNEELEKLVDEQKLELDRLKNMVDNLSKQLAQPRLKVKVGIVDWCALAVSLVAFILGIIAICKSSPRLCDDTLNFDYWGAIIGVLGLLVTVLIGFQIFQIVRFDKEKDSLSADINTFFTSENNKIEDIRHDVEKSKEEISNDIKKHDENIATILASIMDMYAKIGSVNNKIRVNYYYEVVNFGLLSIVRFFNVGDYDQSNICLGLLLKYIPDFSVVHCSQISYNYLINQLYKIKEPLKLEKYELLNANLHRIQIEKKSNA